MSQIFAMLHLDGSCVQPAELETAARSQQINTHTNATPRLWRDTDGDDNIGLVHLRQIITAEDRLERPWSSDDTTSHSRHSTDASTSPGNLIIADARLDNRSAVARQLRLPAATLAHLPDGAIILAAYDQWGARCMHRLLGDFAFIIWNKTQQRLFCARSPVGNRALYWFRDRARLVVASTTTTLFALPGIQRKLNPAALAEQMAATGRPENTLFQGIHRLPCAHTLSYSRSQPRSEPDIEHYWSPDLSPLRLPSDQHYLERFDEIFAAATKCRLRTVADIGILMSGGLDSTSVAAIAAPMLDANGKRLTAFSSLPPEDLNRPEHVAPPLDELPLLEAMSRRYPNIDLQSIDDRAIGLFEDIEQSFEYTGSASIATANRSWLEKSTTQALGQGINVMLTGALGNGTLSFDGHTRLYGLLRQGHWVTLVRELHAFAATCGISIPRAAINQLLIPMLSPDTQKRLNRWGLSKRRHWSDYSAVSPRTIDALKRRPGYLASRWNRRNGSAEWRAGLLFSGVIEDAFSEESAVRHRFGVDPRDPTADKRLIEFCLSLPDEQYLRRGQDRSLIRRAMQGKLPAAILNQTISGDQAQDWFVKMAPLREEFRQELQRMRHSEAAREIIDLERLEALVENWPGDDWFHEDAIVSYKNALQRGIAAGRFIRWVESKES